MIGFYKVIGKSMEPSFYEGDYLIVNRWAYRSVAPKKGEVVLVQTLQPILKRVSQVKNDQYYVLGDNKKHSTDSRHFGWIHGSQIIGSVLWHVARD